MAEPPGTPAQEGAEHFGQRARAYVYVKKHPLSRGFRKSLVRRMAGLTRAPQREYNSLSDADDASAPRKRARRAKQAHSEHGKPVCIGTDRPSAWECAAAAKRIDDMRAAPVKPPILSHTGRKPRLNIVACAMALERGEEFKSDAEACRLFGIHENYDVRRLWVEFKFTRLAAYQRTIVLHGDTRADQEAFLNLLRMYPTGPISVMSGSCDYRAAVDSLWCNEIVEAVKHRYSKAREVAPHEAHTLRIRPPMPSAYSVDMTENVVFTLHKLAATCGKTVNHEGFKVVNPEVRVAIIWPDALECYQQRDALFETLHENQWARENVHVLLNNSMAGAVGPHGLWRFLPCHASDDIIINSYGDWYPWGSVAFLARC